MIYRIFYWIHITSYLLWLIALAGSMLFAFKVGQNYQTPEEKQYMKLERKVTSIGTHVGVLGILISGWVLVSIPGGPQWGWFNFMLYPWLGLKQVIFLLILMLVAFSVRRNVSFKKILRDEQETPVIDATRRSWKRAYNMSLVVYMLVVIDTILGLTKPF